MKSFDRKLIVKTVLIIFFLGNFSAITEAQNSNLMMFSTEQPVEFVDLKKIGVKESFNPENSNENKIFKPLTNESNASSVKFKFVIFKGQIIPSSDIKSIEGGLLFLDKQRFKSMGLSLLKGDSNSVFNTDFNILISDRIAEMYFKDKDPIDNVLVLEGKYSFMIKGVFKSKNNSLPMEFDFISAPITNEKIEHRR